VTAQDATRRPTLFRLRALREEYGPSPSTIWKQVNLGLWPPPIKLTGKSIAFVVAECDQVIQARIRGASDDEIRALVKTQVAARKTVGIEATCVQAQQQVQAQGQRQLIGKAPATAPEPATAPARDAGPGAGQGAGAGAEAGTGTGAVWT